MSFRILLAVCAGVLLGSVRGELNPASLPAVGYRELRALSPTLLELTLVTTKEPDPAAPIQWNFVGSNFEPALPGVEAFQVRAGARAIPVVRVGFKRRPLYAPLRKRDLRIGNQIYLELGAAVAESETVSVQNPAGNLWPAGQNWEAVVSARRNNPALHVNQIGYMPGETKKGMVGYYLGSLGEMPISAGIFNIVDASTGQTVFSGNLKARKDVGYTYIPAPYQQVLEADFTVLQAPGEYQLQVAGMGVSFPFLIHQGTAAAFARTYALGLYHQRCGTVNSLPHTRHEHGICHAAPAAVPDMTFASANYQLSAMSYDYANNPMHTAPQLKSIDSSLYPFVNRGVMDVAGGHHDAGDYSKYTINSAGLIHHLAFAADALGAGGLDNLGLPESGDGKSDLLQEAKWEADFLAKMQDADGGFYFLVYPRDRAYEDDVLPDHGDSQVVFPKTTAATAAAVGALAEMASSPRFKQQFPAEAAVYLGKAKLGWNFLMQAIARHGKNGAYQKITHYGNEFMHDDELAWAAAALFAATGESQYHAKLLEFFPDPNLKATRRWDWWRLFEGYGCAVRTYAFAARSGRLAASQLNASYLAKCEAEIVAAGDDIARFAEQTAYGTSFPDLSKAYRSAGWYFSLERAFELATAHRLQPQARYLDSILSNAAYEAGCNPVNMSYITGAGWTRWRDVVHQYAMNDTRVLPPSGLPLGNIQGGFAYLENYKQELGKLCYPPDGSASAPYPFYDRFGDSFNTTTEFVVVDQARGLATLAFMLARSGDTTSASKSVVGRIVGLPATVPAGELVSARLDVDGVSLDLARVTWEATDQEPFIGPIFSFVPKNSGEQWIEAEALLPDGRRVFATNRFTASFPISIAPNAFKSQPAPVAADVVAVYRLDANTADSAGRAGALALSGRARLDTMNLGWMQTRAGSALRFEDLGDMAAVAIPTNLIYTNGSTTEIMIEAMVYVHSYKGWNKGRASILTLTKGWNASLEFIEDIYAGPILRGGAQFAVSSAMLGSELPVQKWHHLAISLSSTGYTARVNGKSIASVASTELKEWANGSATLEIGNFEGWIDEVIVRRKDSSGTVVPTPRETSVQLVCENKNIIYGDAIALVAKVTSAVAPSGKVAFKNGTKIMGYAQVEPRTATVSEARFVLSGATVGRFLFSANFEGDAGFKPSVTASVAATVLPKPLKITGLVARNKPFDGTTVAQLQGDARLEGIVPGDAISLTGIPLAQFGSADVGAVKPVYVSGYAIAGAKKANYGLTPLILSASITNKILASRFLVEADWTTGGGWIGRYGSRGAIIPDFLSSVPDYVESVTIDNTASWIWEYSSVEPSALRKPNANEGIASCWYSPTGFSVKLKMRDDQEHKVSFYCADFDRAGRNQTIELRNPATGPAIESRSISQFQDGVWIIGEMRGEVEIRFTNAGPLNAVLSGLFFD